MTNAVSLAQQASTGVSQGFKNRIINGAMVIDQRNAGASISTSSTGGQTYSSLDRWAYVVSQASKFTMQQNAGSVTPPAGFTNYLGCTSTAATSVGSSDYFNINQIIEGFNIADLGWGTANAKTVTLSFWVRSSLTGTFGGALRNSALNRSYPYTYTISSANTWEQKSITIAGDTSGTWLTTSGHGIQVVFSLGMGSNFSGTASAWAGANYASATGATSVVGTNGATLYITGIQFEVGSSATSFETRAYGTELQLCERYFQIVGEWNGCGNSSTNWLGVASARTSMRSTPSIGQSGLLQVSDFFGTDAGQSSTSIAILNSNNTTLSVCFWIFNLSGLTGGKYYGGIRNSGGNFPSYLTFSAEL